MFLSSLPSEILINIIQYLSLKDLARISTLSHFLHNIVSQCGWSTYDLLNPRPSFSLSSLRKHQDHAARVRYNVLTDRAWDRTDFVARPLARPWLTKFSPILAISPTRLVVAAGSEIYSYNLSHADNSPTISFEGVCSLSDPDQKKSDITALTFLDDGGKNCTLCVGFHRGAVERLILHPDSISSSDSAEPTITFTRIPHPLLLAEADFLEHLTSTPSSSLLLSLSSAGRATLSSLSPNGASSTYNLNSHGWTALLSPFSSTPYAAFGTSSTSPLSIHAIESGSQISPTVTANLLPSIRAASASTTTNSSALPPTSTAVYGIAHAPPSAPWGASPEIIVSGWFDGQVRCHDLRSSLRASSSPSSWAVNGGRSTNQLAPSLTLLNPYSDEPIYSLATGGGSGAHVGAGTARHSVVSFWDVRMSGKAFVAKMGGGGHGENVNANINSNTTFLPSAAVKQTKGWSVHAPGNDRSPVFSLIMESSRVWGATESRVFIYDFGPNATSDSFPPLPLKRSVDGTKRMDIPVSSEEVDTQPAYAHSPTSNAPVGGRKGKTRFGVGYYVTKYEHGHAGGASVSNTAAAAVGGGGGGGGSA